MPIALMAFMGDSGITVILVSVFYIVSPMFTMYLCNFTIVYYYLNPIVDETDIYIAP